MNNPVQIEEITQADEQAAVIAVAGELDLLAAPELYQRAVSALEGRQDLIIDMSRVTFCDSSGFNALIRLHRRAKEAGGQLTLAAPPDQVTRLLTLSGAESIFPTRATLAEARAAHTAASDDATG
jgi:anti-sigma B factor antagonist